MTPSTPDRPTPRPEPPNPRDRREAPGERESQPARLTPVFPIPFPGKPRAA